MSFQIKVRIISAEGLVDGKTESSFCKITVDGKSKYKTSIIRKDENPRWDESFVLSVSNPETDVLNIWVKTVKKIGQNTTVGATEIPLTGLTKGIESNARKYLGNGAHINIGLTPMDFGAAARVKEAGAPSLPPAEEIEAQFKAVLENLGASADVQRDMGSMSLESKWDLVKQHGKVELSAMTKVENNPQIWTHKLRTEPTVKNMQSLRVLLSGEPLAWISKFISLDGIDLIVAVLEEVEKKRNKSIEDVQVLVECIRCLRAIMNNKVGLQDVLKREKALNTMVLCLDFAEGVDLRFRTMLLNQLTVLCGSPDGHRLVMNAMNYYKSKKQEKRRFQDLLHRMQNAVEIELKTAYMALVNAFANSPSDIDLRVAVRNELARCDLQAILEKFKETIPLEENPELSQQIDIYEEEDNLDHRELQERFADLDIDIDDIDDVFHTLVLRTRGTGLSATFLQILQNLLLISTETGQKSWLLAARIIRQISLQKSEIGEVNLDHLLTTVETEAEIIPYVKKIEELEQKYRDLDKKARTYEIENKEKDDIIKEFKKGTFVPAPEAPSPPLQPNDSDMSLGEPAPPPPLPPLPGFASPDAPPIAPAMPPADAPPLPGALSSKKKPKREYMKEPATKMKGLHWNKIEHKNIKGTLFEEFGDNLEGIQLDFSDIEQNFAAKVTVVKKSEDSNSNEEPKQELVLVLNHKASQNMQIFLSQFKAVSQSDICRAIRHLNERVLQVNHIKQILAFLPSKNEISLIEAAVAQNGGNPSCLGHAERFALELSKVSSVDLRLQAFLFKVEFTNRKSEIKPNIEIMSQACTEMLESQKFKKMLEIILAIGNYMNGGTRRGEAFGFKITALSKLNEVRTSDNKKTFLFYVVDLIHKQNLDLMSWRDELKSIASAARVSYQSLSADVNNLRRDFKNVERSLEIIPKESDRFHELMENFLSEINPDLNKMAADFLKIETLFQKAASYFATDPKMAPEEFFGVIHKFMIDFGDAVKQYDLEQQKKERELKRQQAINNNQAPKPKASGTPTRLSRGATQTGLDNDPDSAFNSMLTALQSGNAFRARREKIDQAFKEKEKSEQH